MHLAPSYTIPDCYRSVVVFIPYWASSYTASDMQRFDNDCESHSALEVVYSAPIAIRYSVTGALDSCDVSWRTYGVFIAPASKHYIMLLLIRGEAADKYGGATLDSSPPLL